KGVDYSVAGLSYDVNGNILTMNQKGWTIQGSKMIDSLQYKYLSGTNRLQNVIDFKNDTLTKLGDFRSSSNYMKTLGGSKTSSATDYSYDVSGNLTLDNNKDISKITYNYVNLSDTINIKGKGKIVYT